MHELWTAVRPVGHRGRQPTLGTVVTVVAACGPLPYVVMRLTWLTPWPLGAPDLTAQPEVRVWGLLLGLGALGGSVLTVGLIRPWGERFPRWMPVVGGRVVPIQLAVVPASIVAVAVTTAAHSMLQVTLTSTELMSGVLERVLSVVVFPFWLWGPALGLATWAYLLRRRAGCAACGRTGCGRRDWTP